MVFIHQRTEHGLVERTPIGTDAHGLFVFQRELDDGRKLGIPFFPETDIAGVDAVLGQRLRAGRFGGEQLVAVIVEIADQRHADAHHVQALADARHGSRRFRRVDGNAHEFRSRARQLGDLFRGRGDIRCVGIRHRLHDDGRVAADLHAADLHAHAAPARPHACILIFEIHCRWELAEADS